MKIKVVSTRGDKDEITWTIKGNESKAICTYIHSKRESRIPFPSKEAAIKWAKEQAQLAIDVGGYKRA